MKKFGEFICKNKNIVIIISTILLILSIIGSKLTKINYDILVYLPDEIETIKGQDILVNDFNMGSYSVAVIDNMSSKDILQLEDDLKEIDGVAKVVSLYDVIGTTIPVSMLPNEIVEKVHQGDSDLLLITFNGSTSSEETLDAVQKIRDVTDERVNQGGMSSMVLDTMNLSEKEITIYVIIAVALCIAVLELFLDSYIVPIILLANIGCAILFNLGTNMFLGEISYITKALVAVLQLGVTTDFSIFLYHSYEKKKSKYKIKEEAMQEAIKETFASVTGSSLTTIVGFLALCAMQLTLGTDLGIVMAKGVLLGVITVLTLFPSLLLVFDKVIEKTKHKELVPNFNGLNKFIIKHHKKIFVVFLIFLIPTYLAYKKIDVYYKLDSSLPETLESVSTNQILKDKYNIVSLEMILTSKDLKNDDVVNMIAEIKDVDGVDFVLSFAELKKLGITEEMLSDDLVDIFENDEYQISLLNSTYDIATDELNNQTEIINNIVKKYDSNAIIAGEGPLMKDLVEISNTDFNNVNIYSIVCIFMVLFIVLKSLSLPFLLIVAIEFAIFVNMSISYFSGSVLPFIAPIVLGTIQLGATIDYAILMTTNYLAKRRDGIAKEEAMLNTLNYCGTSILISGMCFFAATFGVGLYSDIEMIGTICTLISRGAIISMAVVITVLPAILLIFDKLILKTTLTKGRKDNMKKIMKKATAIILVFGIAFRSVPINAKALTKDETVYSKLNADGTIQTTLVNEKLLNNLDLEEIEDYSELQDILNISNDSTYVKANRKITWKANGKDIFYQGTTTKNLPVTTNVTYKLDGKAMDVKDMLGKSGEVTITIKYTNHDKHGNLYTPFVVTTGTIIDSKNNKNVIVNNGKVISNGTKKIVVGMSAPGLYESLGLEELKGMDTITITYDTDKFELSSIYSVMTPKILESSDLKAFDKLDGILGNVDALQENMNLINEGANKLSDGSNYLKDSLEKAIKDLENNSNHVLNNEQIETIKESAWKQVQAGLASSSDSKILEFGTAAVTKAVVEYLQTVGEYNDYVNCETGKVMYEKTGSMTPEQMASCNIISSDTTLPLIQKAATTGVTDVTGNTVNYIAEKISKMVAASVAEATAEQVMVSSLKNLESLYAGVSQLDNGAKTLSLGIDKFNEEGISKITKLANYNVKDITNKLQILVKLGENYSTFAGKLNNINGTTKFISVIDPIKIIEAKKEIVDNKEKLTFIDRLKNLFK